MSYHPPKINTAYIFYIGLLSQSNPNIMQANPTIAAGDFQVSIDGGTLANLATLPAVAPASSKMLKVSLSAAEMNGDNITVVGSDAAGSEWTDILINLQTVANQNDDLATTSSILGAVVEGAVTVQQSLMLANSVLGGKASGLATTNAKYRDLADTKDRIDATVDENGNRTAVTRDLT